MANKRVFPSFPLKPKPAARRGSPPCRRRTARRKALLHPTSNLRDTRARRSEPAFWSSDVSRFRRLAPSRSQNDTQTSPDIPYCTRRASAIDEFLSSAIQFVVDPDILFFVLSSALSLSPSFATRGLRKLKRPPRSSPLFLLSILLLRRRARNGRTNERRRILKFFWSVSNSSASIFFFYIHLLSAQVPSTPGARGVGV